MKPCKHGHVDGAMHIPCPKCQAEHYAEQVDDLEELNASLRQDKKILLGVIKERDETIQSLQAENDRLKKGFEEIRHAAVTRTGIDFNTANLFCAIANRILTGD